VFCGPVFSIEMVLIPCAILQLIWSWPFAVSFGRNFFAGITAGC